MEEIRIFTHGTNATFVCPNCNVSRTADVAKVLKSEIQIKIKCKCKCGHTFKAIIERRKYFRKAIELQGFFYSLTEKIKTFMIVTDISRSGCKLKINSSNNNFNVGDRVFIEFNLDDSYHSLIRKEGVIRASKDQFLGLEFDSIGEYDNLGRYLMFR